MQQNSTGSQGSHLIRVDTNVYFLEFVTIPASVFWIHCILHMLRLAPEDRVAVIKATTHQGISCQDSSLISQKLYNLMHLYEASIINIAELFDLV